MLEKSEIIVLVVRVRAETEVRDSGVKNTISREWEPNGRSTRLFGNTGDCYLEKWSLQEMGAVV